MIFHKLRGLPVLEFAFGGSRAAFGFGSFLGNFLEMLLRVERGFRADSGLDISRGSFIRMSERPFENAMDDEIGIATNGRSEVGIFVEAESEVAERIRSVTSLLE